MNSEEGKWRLQSALKHKPVFLVLNDVWYEKHMEYLDVVSADSLLLITSCNRHVGNCLGAQCYDVKPLNDAQSMDLFCQHAFGGGEPSNCQNEFVDDIVKECSGVPLALAVMGRQARTHSCKGDTAARPSPDEKEKWNYTVATLKERGVVHETVFDKIFSLSFESLESLHQKVLLNLAMLPEDSHIRRSDLVHLRLRIGTL